MIRMTKWFVLFALLTLTPALSMGQIVCTEDPVSGCIVNLPSSADVWVASDGEAPFSPWGLVGDISDGISFYGPNAPNWVADTRFPGMRGNVWVPCPGCTSAPGTNTWVLPAVTNCGPENEPRCELLGAWYLPGFVLSGFQGFTIEEVGGGFSDFISITNFGPNGTEEVIFHSDPIPEPSSLLLLGSGLLCAVGFACRRSFP